MQEARRYFHDELAALEKSVLEMGAAAQDQFALAIKAVTGDERSICETVIERDDEIDGFYLDIEQRILDVLALQTPVASDLRLLTSLLHINLHLERVGDMAVNVAKIAELAWGLPRDERILRHLDEMGSIALRMLGAAMEAFRTRDVDLCRQLPDMDDPIDRLNRGMLTQVLEFSGNKPLLEWGVRMHVVSRQLERVGDHAVDIGEQVAFLVTGEFAEFTDASHPEIENPDLE